MVALQDRLDAFLARTDDGSFYVGHATILARINEKLILIDPVFDRPLFLDSWLFFPSLVSSARLFDVDAVLISHCHEDHYDPDFLRKLRPGTPIYMTDGCTGFEQIEGDQSLNTNRLAREELTQIFDGVQVYTIPSDHNDFDSSFVVKGRRFALFQGNDNFVTLEVMERAAAVVGTVDHAYIPYSYVWWYPFCLTSMPEEERAAEAKRLTERNMAIGRMMSNVLKASHVIPSAGNLILCDYVDSPVNRGIASPFDYATYAKGLGEGAKVNVLVAGDYILDVEGTSEVVSQSYGKDEYFRRMDDFLTAFNLQNPEDERGNPITEDDLMSLRLRVAALPTLETNHHVVIRRADRSHELIDIDVNARSVRLVDRPPPDGVMMLFDLQGPPFEQWLSGAISFETVLNSQRFTVFRRPEQFYEPVWRAIRTCL